MLAVRCALAGERCVAASTSEAPTPRPPLAKGGLACGRAGAFCAARTSKGGTRLPPVEKGRRASGRACGDWPGGTQPKGPGFFSSLLLLPLLLTIPDLRVKLDALPSAIATGSTMKPTTAPGFPTSRSNRLERGRSARLSR